MTRINSRPVALATALAAGAALAPPAHAQEHAHAPAPTFAIPLSLRAEHAEIHAALERATTAPGKVGEAARALAKVLHPHFVREEQVALPPLALLAPLARGEYTAAMRDVLPLTDTLRAELPKMLEEHAAIRAATIRLGEVARAAGNVAVVRLTEQLKAHALNEEEVTYPAAILVGDLVRARLMVGATAR